MDSVLKDFALGQLAGCLLIGRSENDLGLSSVLCP